MATRNISFSIPTAREQLAALGLTPQEIEESIALLTQKYGPLDKLVPGVYSVELTVPEPPPVTFTNQQMITAIYNLAREEGLDGWALLSRAGLTYLIRDRQATYSGSAIDALSGLSPQERIRLGALLGVPVSTVAGPVSVVAGAPSITWVGPTENHAPGRGGQAIDWIVAHYTASGSTSGVLSWFKNPSARVSAHYVIGRDGEIYQLVRDEDTAWHAGLVARSGLSDEENEKRATRNAQLHPNQRGIGIEIVDWGLLRRDGDNYFNWTNNWTGLHKGEVVEAGGYYWEPYTEAQYNSIIALVRYLCQHYGVPAQFPLHGPGTYHEQIEDLLNFRGLLGHQAIDNTKTDPGAHFDWGRLLAGVKG
jgi:N-acetyl-anhydromuramyl-L-alanine amidase AmpD